ncbi:MAG: hypothetical protein HQL02_08650 [Nitrospirae bacterium]|nr:hypothetical protein [Nitrospirota bacterium]
MLSLIKEDYSNGCIIKRVDRLECLIAEAIEFQVVIRSGCSMTIRRCEPHWQ